jgi:predicted phage baseplate assembly protein
MQDLQQHGLTEADVRTVTDRRTGKITEVWVRWQERPNLFFSSGNDRHYLLERSRGRLLFGDGRQGRIPPVGKDNIRALQYRSGGGLVGNVSQNQIAQLLSGVTAQSIHNPRSGEGGADGETVSSVLQRGPKSLRHRYQAIALADYEALAREASPAIAVARALPTTHPSGRPAPGWVKLIIMPQSQDPQPQPSFELRRQVEAYLSQRMPAAIADQIVVTGPDYLPIGVEAIVIPVNPPDAGIVLERVREALTQFLNPLMGGPAGLGWTFGRSVYLSDVAAMLERVAGVDYISQLNLLRDGTPQPEEVAIPADRIVVAGPLRILLQGEED